MKNKYFIIQYTSGDAWEVKKGVMIVESKKRQEAMMLFKNKMPDRSVTNIKILKKTKSAIIFNQDVSIL